MASGFDPKKQFSLIYGSAAGLRQRLIDQIIAAALPPEEREWGLIVVDGPEAGVAGIISHLRAGSLMAPDRVVVVRGIDKLPAAAQKQLAAALPNVAGETRVVFESDSDGDSRGGAPLKADLKKALEASGQLVPATPPSDRELPSWIVQEAADRGKRMAMPVATAFVGVVGGRIDLMLTELDKLVTYVGPEEEQITVHDVREIVCGEKESTVFELVDCIGKRDARGALTILPDLLPASGVQGAAIGLLGMISRQIRVIWQAQALTKAGFRLEGMSKAPEGWEDRLPAEHNFFTTTRGRGFLVSKYCDQARNFNDVQLVRAMIRIYETELALKGQSDRRMDDRLALETLIVSLCRL